MPHSQCFWTSQVILQYIAFLGYYKDSGKVSLLIEPVLMAEDRWSPLTMT